mgnify:CR=1 FL=1
MTQQEFEYLKSHLRPFTGEDARSRKWEAEADSAAKAGSIIEACYYLLNAAWYKGVADTEAENLNALRDAVLGDGK